MNVVELTFSFAIAKGYLPRVLLIISSLLLFKYVV